MDTLSINPGKLSLERLTLNLRQDERGYYWQTEIGENTDARFSNPHDAIADLITLWSTGCHTPLPELALS